MHGHGVLRTSCVQRRPRAGCSLEGIARSKGGETSSCVIVQGAGCEISITLTMLLTMLLSLHAASSRIKRERPGGGKKLTLILPHLLFWDYS